MNINYISYYYYIKYTKKKLNKLHSRNYFLYIV
jgi:hypothetical protein